MINYKLPLILGISGTAVAGGTYGIINYSSNSSNSQEKELERVIITSKEEKNEIPDIIAEIILKSNEGKNKEWICKQLSEGEDLEQVENEEDWICKEWVNRNLKERKETKNWLLWVKVDNKAESIEKVLNKYELKESSNSAESVWSPKESITCSKQDSIEQGKEKVIIACEKSETPNN